MMECSWDESERGDGAGDNNCHGGNGSAVDVAADWRLARPLTHNVVYRVERIGGDGGALQRRNHR